MHRVKIETKRIIQYATFIYRDKKKKLSHAIFHVCHLHNCVLAICISSLTLATFARTYTVDTKGKGKKGHNNVKYEFSFSSGCVFVVVLASKGNIFLLYGYSKNGIHSQYTDNERPQYSLTEYATQRMGQMESKV